MFEPVPYYNLSRDSIKKINAFISRVAYHAKLYKIDCSNRFSFILSACASLKNLLKQKGQDVWPKDSYEPITAFQDMFQLLIYGLGDKGLLFHHNGCWQGVIHTEPDEKFLSEWSDSERAYKELAFAMKCQSEAYLKVIALRSNLKSHINQERNYDTPISDIDSLAAMSASYFVTPLHQIRPELDMEIIRNVASNLFKDRLFSQYAPLYLYYALSGENPAVYDARDFWKDLSFHMKKPSAINQPQRRKEIREKCLLYHQIEEVVKRESCFLSISQMEFEPSSILSKISNRLNLNFSVEEATVIRKASLSYYRHPRSQSSIDIKIKDIPIMEIMNAFFCIWMSQDYNFLRKGIIKPRNLQNALQLIYQSGLVTPIDNIPPNTNGYSASDYNEIKRKILLEYPTTRYECSQQVFWLTTGFIPPHDYPFPEQQKDSDKPRAPLNLYAICHQHLCYISSILQAYGKTISSSPSIPYEVYIDILKARTFFSSKWNADIEREFIDLFIDTINNLSYLEQDREIKLINFVKEKYELFKKHSNNGTEKHSKVSYKSFQYADNEIYKALIYDCFSLTGIHIYQEVFSLLASLNRSLWPL